VLQVSKTRQRELPITAHALDHCKPQHCSVRLVTPSRRHGKDVIERDAAFPLPLTIHAPPAKHTKVNRRKRSSARRESPARVSDDQHSIAVESPSSNGALARTAASIPEARSSVGVGHGCIAGGGARDSDSEMSNLSSCDERYCSAQ
jgi:hypothetical protein